MSEKKKNLTKEVWTPVGRFSYPYLHRVDSGRPSSDDAYKTDLFIDKGIWKEKGRELQEAVLEVGKDAFGPKFSLKSDAYKHPFKDTDVLEDQALTGCILIKAASKPRRNKQTKAIETPARQPIVLGPRRINGKLPELTQEEIAAIKGGDWGKLLVCVCAYSYLGKGVTLYLNAVQYWKEGDAFGQGRSKLLDTVEDLEEEIEDEDVNTDSSSVSSDSAEDLF